MTDVILFDPKGMTIKQVIAKAKAFQKVRPDLEVFCDGDTRCFVGRPRV